MSEEAVGGAEGVAGAHSEKVPFDYVGREVFPTCLVLWKLLAHRKR